MQKRILGAIALLGLASSAVVTGEVVGLATGNAERGATVYERCEGCHSLDSNRVGPRHRGVYGRVAGSVSDYRYSAALRDADHRWNEESLDAWLANPGKFVPGSRMGFRLSDPQERADVIAFLKSQTDD
jgi:cytochrome c